MTKTSPTPLTIAKTVRDDQDITDPTEDDKKTMISLPSRDEEEEPTFTASAEKVESKDLGSAKKVTMTVAPFSLPED